MARFQVRREMFGPHDLVCLRDTVTEASAGVAAHGATLIYYKVPWKGEIVNVAPGFETPEAMLDGAGGKAILMAPWSNRIPDGVYEWDGETHRLPVNHPATQSAIHGLLRHETCSISQENERGDAAEVVFRTRALRAGAFAGYPFDVDVEVTCSLRESGFAMEVTARNVGERDAPFACGWHPYFRAPGRKRIDDLVLTVPSASAIAVNERLIPLDGVAAYASAAERNLDFRAGDRVGDRVIDAALAELTPDGDGLRRTRLADPESGFALTVWQERGLMHVFTGDRSALALEPVECMTNAYNRPECADALRLAPGAAKSFRFGVAVG
ncbi:MAG: aldose 1-epimerase [Planctomycetota bacterium]